MKSLTKLLTANDVGATGSHQVGVHVPKTGGFISFFPRLDSSRKNPDARIVFRDFANLKWEFRFVHYNNKYFGGTRDEYRLCWITPFLKSHGAEEGDGIALHQLEACSYLIEIRKKIRKTEEHLPLSYVNESFQVPYMKTIKLSFDKNWEMTEN
jgi:hypothetical protein